MNTPSEPLWHYSNGSSNFGPLGTSAIRQLASAGVIGPDHLICPDGTEAWLPLAQVNLDAPAAPSVPSPEAKSIAPAPPAPSYFLNLQGGTSGPFTAADIRDQLMRQEIGSGALAWKEGMPEWLPVGQIAELRPAASMPPPPPPGTTAGQAPPMGTTFPTASSHGPENAFERYYLNVLKKYAVFTGRATRKEFWMFTLFSFIVWFALGVVDGMMNGGPLSGLYSLGVFVPSIAVGVRRMQDTDHNGWWIFCPIVNLVFAVTEGTRGGNRFGSDPIANAAQVQPQAHAGS